jgi:hypothetical protein
MGIELIDILKRSPSKWNCVVVQAAVRGLVYAVKLQLLELRTVPGLKILWEVSAK